MIIVNAICYIALVYLLWRVDKKATLFAKLNVSLVEELDQKNNLIEDLQSRLEIVKKETIFILDQHEEIMHNNNKLNDEIKYVKDMHKKAIENFEQITASNNKLHLKQLKEAEKKAREDALKRSRSVIRGQATEHLAPFMVEGINPKDCRFLGNPVDYIVFDGLSELADKTIDHIKEIKFVDIKTGKSSLNTAQRRIRDAVKDARVSFSIVNPEENKNEKDKTN